MQSQEGNTGNWGSGSPNPTHRHSSDKVPLFNDSGHEQPEVVKSEETTKAHPTNNEQPLDDLDLMLLHEDFPQLLTLSAQVKELRNTLVNPPASRQTVSSALSPAEIHAVVGRMQQQLLRFPKQRHQSIPRGKYPMTDFTMDDSIKTLKGEWEHLKQFVDVRDGKKAATEITPTPKKRGGRNGKGKEAIALKYAKWQTDILMNWMIQHREQPFPDQVQIQELMEQTGLSQSQVVNWTTNVRKRNRKATCEGGKKPHHFIDFLFLVQDRENRKKKERDDAVSIGNGQLHDVSFDADSSEGHHQPLPFLDQSRSRSPYRTASPIEEARNDWSAVVHETPHASRRHVVAHTPPSSMLQPVRHRANFGGQVYHGDQEGEYFDGVTVEEHHRYPNNYSTGRPPQMSPRQTVPLPFSRLNEERASVEPISFEEESLNEDLMHDFAELWLTATSESGILPSVTEDSHESRSSGSFDDEQTAPELVASEGRKRERASSFDVEELNNEDIHSWAAEMGLLIDL